MSEGGSKKSGSNPMVSLLAGSITGGIEATAVWPMEYMKTQLQLQSKLPGAPKLPFTGIVDGIKYTVRTHGFLALYDGLSVTLLFSVPKAGIRFGGNAYCKQLLQDEKGKLSMGRQFLAGMGAGIVEAVFAVTPMETIKTKLIERNLSLVSGVKHILQTSGIAGLYQGLMATVLKQASNQGLRFMFFNKYKDIVTNNGEKELGSIGAFMGGMGAGTFSTIGNNPFDVVKTKMQASDARQKYANTLDCFVKILRTEGVAGYYRGIVARMGRVVPGQGIVFMSFETIEKWIATALSK